MEKAAIVIRPPNMNRYANFALTIQTINNSIIALACSPLFAGGAKSVGFNVASMIIRAFLI